MHRAGFKRLPEAVVALELARRQKLGQPHTMTTLADALDMPKSTVSRLIWALADEYKLVTQTQDGADRRKRWVEIDLVKLDALMGKGA